MPSRRASLGERMLTSAPSILMLPELGRSIPDRMLIRVDLPAPFSPSRQSTSPCRTVTLTRSLAMTPGNCFVMLTSSMAGTRSGDCVPATPTPSRCGRRLAVRRYERLHLGQGRRHRHLELARDDLLLRSLDLIPDAGRDVCRLKERDAAVREVQVVAVVAVGAVLDVLDRLGVRVREVPQLRGEQDMLGVDRADVADVAYVPDLMPDVRVRDGRKIAEGCLVSHAEDHVSTRRHQGLGDSLPAG